MKSTILKNPLAALPLLKTKNLWAACLFLLPFIAQAQFDYIVTNGTVTITGYAGSGGVVTIPGEINAVPVTAIGSNAFHYSTVTSVSIPSTVTSLGAGAFSECTRLTNIALPSGLTRLVTDFTDISHSHGTFYRCTNLITLTLPDTLTAIGADTFAYCANLTEIHLPAAVTDLGAGAFYYCTALKSLTIAGSLANLGVAVFYGCTSLTNVDLRNSSFTSLNADVYLNPMPFIEPAYSYGCWGMFTSCRSLTSINLPNTITNIGNLTFGFCTNLTSITIPDSVITISEEVPSSYGGVPILDHGPLGAFVGCTSLTNITFGNHLLTMRSDTFNCCTKLATVVLPDSLAYVEGSGLFRNCSNLTTVVFGKSIANIGYATFHDCQNLQSVVFTGNSPWTPSGPGYGIFTGDTNAVVYYLPGKTGWGSTFSDKPAVLWNPEIQTTRPDFGIGPNGFGFSITGSTNIPLYVETCTNLAHPDWVPLQALTLTNGSIVFSDPDSLTAPYRFYRLRFASLLLPGFRPQFSYITNNGTITITRYIGPAVNEVSIPGTINGIPVTCIGNSAFYYCTALTSVSIPNSVTNLGDRAFASCTALTSITIPSGVKKLGTNLFASCSSLTNVTLPNNLTSLDGTFNGCIKLANFTLPATLTSIGDYTFDGCSFSTLQIPSGVTNIGASAFAWCPYLNTLTLPANVKHLGYQAFNNCSSLTNLDLGSTSIKNLDGHISIIQYPTGISYDCAGIFESCTNLTRITLPNTVTNIGNRTFANCTSLATITIRSGVTAIGDTIPMGAMVYRPTGAFVNCPNLTSVYFEGNAPALLSSDPIFPNSTNATVYYLAGATGWGSTYSGRPTALWNR